MSFSNADQGDFKNFFIRPTVDLTVGHQDLAWAATLDRRNIVERWHSESGRSILSKWKSDHFSRQMLDSLIGKYYGQTDLRGINLSNEEIQDVDLSNCDLFASDLKNTDFVRCKLNHSYLSEANIRGTSFDYCQMNDVLIDNAEFNAKTSFIGVDLNRINFNLAWALRNHAINQQKIFDLEKRYPKFSLFLKITCDYGRSFLRFFGWCLGIVLVFALLFSMPGMLKEPGFWNGLYTSITTFTTIGSEISAVSLLGRMLVAIESCLGYMMGSLLISILAKRIIID